MPHKENPINIFKKDSNINDLASWDALVVLTEQLLIKYPSPTEIIKQTITKTFDELLTRFPLFFGYWKKYVSLIYQIYGIDESIKVLVRSLDSFPQSLELWLDYMTILISNFNEDKEKIRFNFTKGLKYVGNHFLSHPLWDKYLEFEQNEGNLNNVLQILLQVIKIPLHQYSKYYQMFLTTRQSVPIDDIVELEEGLIIPKDVNEEGKIKLVDEYFNNVFLNTQTYVAEIWPFESQIKQSFFTLSHVSKQEFDNWDNYLNFQITKHSNTLTPLTKQQTISTFERSLIPTALYPKFWYKYLDWYLDNYPQEFDNINSIYLKAVNLFIPIKFIDIRLNYALFLQANKQDHDKIHDVYLSIISYVPYEFKPIIRYIRFLSSLNNSNHKKTCEILESILANYFNRQRKMELEYHLTRFIKLLNDKTISIIIVELIKINWIFIKNHLNVKKNLNYYSKFEILNGSIPFWTMNYKYHKQYHDFKNLTKIIEFIKNGSSLPISTITLILTDYTEFLKTNHQSDSSISIFDLNNHTKILQLEADLSNPLESRFKMDHQLQKRQKRQSGHPGVLIDKPEITNTLIDSPISRTRIPPLPTFKNVEKASLPIEYTPDE